MPEPATPHSERPWEDPGQMISVDQALERILAAVSPLPPGMVHLTNALGLVLASDIIAGADVPPFRNSAMDGYAVRSGDTTGASVQHPVELSVAGAIAAGDSPGMVVDPGQAIRIMTGAPMPSGADAVVRFEETDEIDRSAMVEPPSHAFIGIQRSPKALDNVRPAGEDIARGDLALPAGKLLRPQEIGLLAAINVTEVSVHRRPKVAVLSTGDELADIGELLQPGQVRNSNSYTLAAMASQAGAIPYIGGIARDTVEDLTAKLEQCRSCDFIVTSGGVSLGDYDVVKDILRAEGAIEIWQVRMKPGKPLTFGRIGATPLLGLPGNPVAAAVSFQQFARPAIRRMLGMRDVSPETVIARLTERVENRGLRRHFVRAILERNGNEGYTVRSAGGQGAGLLTSLTRANALLVIPEDVETAEPGMMFQVQILH